jgi:hypothetical protein
MNQPPMKIAFRTALILFLFLGLASYKKEKPEQGNLVYPSNNCQISNRATSIDVEVDFTQSENVSTLTGVLHGVTTETPPEFVEGIQLGSARARANFDVLISYGIKPVLVVSDLVNLNESSPSADWVSYENEVRNLANTYGNSVIYDIWNEPDMPFFWPWWSGLDMTPPDEQVLGEFLESFKRAHNVIRDELGEEAVIAGPSFAKLRESLIQRFMDFCLQEELKVQVLCVHLLEYSDEKLSQLEQRLTFLYEEFIEGSAYSSVGVTELHVTEYGLPKQYGRPGSMLAFIRIMERSKVDEAMRASWGPSEAFTDDLYGFGVFIGLTSPLIDETQFFEEVNQGGRLSSLLTTDFKPRANWWAYKYYADGAPSRVHASSNLDYIMPLASNTSSQLKHKQVLIANYNDEAVTQKPDKLGINLKGISGSNGATIKLSRIPYLEAGELSEPEVICEYRLVSVRGTH